MDAALVEQLTVAVTDGIRDILTNGDNLSIQGFGSFEVRRKDERLSVHPATGKRFMVPPKIVPVFRPGVTLKDRIKTFTQSEPDTVGDSGLTDDIETSDNNDGQ